MTKPDQQKNVIIISDFFKKDYVEANHPVGGAELNDDVLFTHLEDLGLVHQRIHSNKYTPEIMNLFLKDNKDKVFLISNFANLDFRNLVFLTFNCKYIIYEHDYKFHKNRNPIKHKDFMLPKDQIINFNFFKNAFKVICLSKLHLDIFSNNLKIKNLHNTTCSLWSEDDLQFIESLSNTPKINKCAIVDSPNPIKRRDECIDYCVENNLKYDLISDPNYHNFLKVLSQYKTLVALPGHPEPTPRVIVEAKMLGCNILSNKKTVGVYYEDWFSLSGIELVNKVRKIREGTLNYITELCNG